MRADIVFIELDNSILELTETFIVIWLKGDDDILNTFYIFWEIIVKNNT